MAITKMDVLDSLDKIRICTAYTLDGKTLSEFPDSIDELNRVKPVYEEVPGWQSETTDIKQYDKLPAKAKDYLTRLSELVGVPISMVSVGPDRNQTISTVRF
jgi:adenylosuccinate synthase